MISDFIIYLSRTVMGKSISLDGLSVEIVAADGNYKIFQFNCQWS